MLYWCYIRNNNNKKNIDVTLEIIINDDNNNNNTDVTLEIIIVLMLH